MNTSIKNLKEGWINLSEAFKRFLVFFAIFLIIASYSVSNYLDDYISFLQEASVIERLILNFGLFGLLMLFVVFIAFSTNSKRDVSSVMGYSFNFISPPVLFGKREFRMVCKLRNGIRILVPYSPDPSVIKTRDKLQDIERDVSCEVCGNEYGDESMRSMYFIIEGSIKMLFGFQFDSKKIENYYAYCGRHYKEYAEENRVKVQNKYDLELGDKVSVDFNDRSFDGIIKNVNGIDSFPSLAKKRSRNHPKQPEERVFHIESSSSDSKIFYDLSDRVWSKSGDKLSENGEIYYTN